MGSLCHHTIYHWPRVINSTGHEKDPRDRQVVPTGAAGVRGREGSWWRSHQGRLRGEQKTVAGTWDNIQMSQSGFLQSNKPDLKGGWLLQKWSPPVPPARSGKRLHSVKTGTFQDCGNVLNSDWREARSSSLWDLGRVSGREGLKMGFAFCHSFARTWTMLGATLLSHSHERKGEVSTGYGFISQINTYTPWKRLAPQFCWSYSFFVNKDVHAKTRKKFLQIQLFAQCLIKHAWSSVHWLTLLLIGSPMQVQIFIPGKCS